MGWLGGQKKEPCTRTRNKRKRAEECAYVVAVEARGDEDQVRRKVRELWQQLVAHLGAELGAGLLLFLDVVVVVSVSAWDGRETHA